MTQTMSRNRLLLFILTGSFLAHILAQAYLGSFGRYLADDFCHARVVLHEGVIGSTAYWYNNWSGRFVNFALLGVIDSWGQQFARFIPALVLLGWMAVFTWMCYQLFSVIRMRHPLLVASGMAGAVLYGSLAGKVNVLQSIFWMPGLVGYSLALIWLTFFVGLLLYTLRSSVSQRLFYGLIIVSAVGTFLAGGTSEVYDIFQLTIFVLIGAGLLRFAPPTIKRWGLWMLAAAMVGGILALIIMLAAPGNAIRQAALGAPLPLHLVALRTLLSAFVFVASTLAITHPIATLIVLVVPIFIFSQLVTFDQVPPLPARLVRRLLSLSLAGAFLLILVCIGPPIYSTSSPPAPRLLFIPQFILIGTIAFCGSIVGLSSSSNPTEARQIGIVPLGALGILLIIGPLFSALTTLTQDVPLYQTFATEWDARDREIHAARDQGMQDVEVAMLSVDLGQLADLEVIGADPAHWVNSCAADYYGLKSLRAVEREAG